MYDKVFNTVFREFCRRVYHENRRQGLLKMPHAELFVFTNSTPVSSYISINAINMLFTPQNG